MNEGVDFRDVGGCDECVSLSVSEFNSLMNIYRDTLECLMCLGPYIAGSCKHHEEAKGRKHHRVVVSTPREVDLGARAYFNSVVRWEAGKGTHTAVRSPECDRDGTSLHCVSDPSQPGGLGCRSADPHQSLFVEREAAEKQLKDLYRECRSFTKPNWKFVEPPRGPWKR